MIKARIKELRKSLGLSQAAFGESLGVSRDVINNLEQGRVEPSDLIINMMCAKYRVQEQWLRTGEGGMIPATSRRDKIAVFVAKALRDESDTFQADVLEILADMDEEDWRALKLLSQKHISAKQKKDGSE